MTDQSGFFVRFWGVRGSIACPGQGTVRYGGNTSCLEVRCGTKLIIFDAGTGIRALGDKLVSDGPVDIDLYFTHTHFDHVCGLPFFAPLFVAENRIRMAAGHLLPEYTLKQVLCELMMAPLFPVPPDIFQAQLTYQDFRSGETLHPHPDVCIRTGPLNHPNRATGYRVEYDGRSICYITDTEHPAVGRDQAVVDLVRGADMVIYDSMFTDEEYPRYRDYGHSTWEEGIRVVEAAGAKRLVIFHHDPGHDDAFMDRIAEQAEKLRSGTIVAREGMTLDP
jgi:phosphoribosyl 1,2-cyclic phosphodiesterase